MRIEVVPYDPEWPDAFASIHEEITTAMAGVLVVAIEHVGSTAVPGLAAKPVIDVDVVIELGALDDAIAALQAAGYVHKGEQGVADRHAFDAPPQGPARYVYVVLAGCIALRNHLGVRDALRADRELRDRYGAPKLELGQREFDDREDYVAAKSELIQEILCRAGLTSDEREAIERMNRPDETS